MLHRLLEEYIQQIEDALQSLTGTYVEKFEEEILSPKRLNLRLRIRFKSESTLEINETVVVDGEAISPLGYRYHFQDADNRLLFRYDNTPHFREIDTFPHHKHYQNTVVRTEKPSIRAAILEAAQWEIRTDQRLPERASPKTTSQDFN
jgi:hypothetical protein